MALPLTHLDYIIILGEITVVYMVGCLKCGPIISVFFWDVAILLWPKLCKQLWCLSLWAKASSIDGNVSVDGMC